MAEFGLCDVGQVTREAQMVRLTQFQQNQGFIHELLSSPISVDRIPRPRKLDPGEIR